MKTITPIVFVLALIFSGCAEDQLNINQDPNNPIDVPIQMMMPSIMANLTDIYTGQLNHYISMIVQHIEGRGRCGAINQYTGLRPVSFNTIWSNFYTRILNETRLGIHKSEKNNYNHHKAILLINEAFTLMSLTDVFDEIPYTEAVNGVANENPIYDSQTKIYEIIFDNLSVALNLLENEAGDLFIESEDLFFQGDILKWQKVIHGIRARAFLRLKLYDQAIEEANLAIQSSEENWNFKYDGGDAAAWQYRFNRDRTGGLEFHPTLRNIMLENNDSIRLKLWCPLFTTNHPYFVEDQEVELLTYREIEFIKAECKFRLNGPSQEVLSAYHNGILASFDVLGIEKNIAENFIAQAIISPGIQSLDLEEIMTQKYIALFSQPEVWSDIRRTSIPLLTPTTGNAVPVRLEYPATEYLFNENAPAEGSINIFTDKVGWNR